MASSPKLHLWISLFIICACSKVAVADCGNWLTVNTTATGNPACFRVFTQQSSSYDAAQVFCQGRGGYLAQEVSATVHAGLKPNMVAAARTNQNRFWFGLTDNATNSWLWYTGGTVGAYTNWATPNQFNSQRRRDCGLFVVANGDFKWQSTAQCNQNLPFVCQRDFNAAPPVTTTVAPVNCPNGWVGFPARRWCIRLYTTPASWTDARQQCRQALADLVKINNTYMSQFVDNLVSANKGVYWIGLNDRAKEGNFSWLDDTARANFTDWAVGMPNNSGGNENCVVIDGFGNNKWDDFDCATRYRFICQRIPFTGPPIIIPRTTPRNLNCGPGWEDVTGSDTCLYFGTNVLTWQDARTDCRSRGGTLASIASVQEQSYIAARAMAFTGDFFWIGANDRWTEGGWRWTDGTPFAFLNWADRQPDNSNNADCAVLVQRSGRWNDVPCDSRNAYICKKRGKNTTPSQVTTTTPPAHLAADQMFGCPRGWDNYRGSCYKAVRLSTGVDWATASSSCSSASMGGALVAIIDRDENNFVLSLIPKDYTGPVWIGLQDPQENTFTWVDGTPVQYTNWDVNEPNNRRNQDCVVMRGTNGRWNDAQCSDTNLMYVCKQSKSIQPRAGADEEQGCTNGSIGYGAKCYSFVYGPKNFNDAQNYCKTTYKNLGTLATVDSAHLQAFLAAELDTQRGTAYWIGLSQANDLYKWQSGWPVSFTYWGQNHTGNERSTCVAMQRTGLWANFPCNTPNNSFICESPRSGFSTPATVSTPVRQLPCPKGWTPYNGLCYQAFAVNITNRLSWTQARDFCAGQASGGSLLTVRDNVTHTWLTTNLLKAANQSGNFWIGLNDRDSESGYTWADGTPYLFSNWAFGQPNDQGNKQDCVEWIYPPNFWNDDYCYISKNWICQVPGGSVITTPPTVATATQSTLCGNSSWLLLNNRCYFVSQPGGNDSLATWFDARRKCINMRSDLASIHGEDENGFITSLISKNPIFSFWIGLNDLDADSYTWTDLTALNYVNWARNEPNDNFGGERCVNIRSNGDWSDLQCQLKLGYICKKFAGNFRPTPYIQPPPSGGCPPDFVSLPSLGYCYYVGGTTNTTRKNFTDAAAACSQKLSTSTLASIHSTTEEKLILTLTANLRTASWIGLNDRMIRNRFMWADNSAVTFTSWGRGEPDENLNDNRPGARKDCVSIEVRRNQGAWNDRRCDNTLAYVCQAPKSPTYPTTAPNTTGCQAGYQRYRSSCYKFYKDSYDWATAQSMCKTDGANLATVSSPVEEAFVEILTGHVNDSLQFWLGLKFDQVSSAFSWADGWPVRFTNWAHSEPNTASGQSCVTSMLDAQWQVANCSNKNPFVCEVNLGSPPPTRDFSFGRCPDRNWFSYNGNCYYIETSSTKSWAAANAACTNLGANLASIHSDIEAQTITSYVGRYGQDVWIGLYKGQGTGFSWYDGSELEYVYWGLGEPSDPSSVLHQDCVKIRAQDGTWADTDCGDVNSYICETPQVFVTRGQGGSRPNNGGNNGGQSLPNTGNQGNNGNSSGMSGGAVAGVVIGVLVLVALVVVIGFVVFRYTRGQAISPFAPQKLPSTAESGFDNASYSTSSGANVGFSDA